MAKYKKFAFYLGCIAPNRYPQIESTTKFVMKKLGVEIFEMEKATCCPAPGVLRSFDKLDWMVAGARNICIAEKLEMNLITICSGCFGTLKDVNYHLKGHPEDIPKINEKLKLLGDYEYKGTIEVIHVGDYLTNKLSFEKDILPLVTRKIEGTVAIHYGCHFLKPSHIRQIDNPENPSILEDYIEGLGLTSVDFRNKLTCCGAGGGIKAAYSDDSMTILGDKMKDIDEVKPDFIFDVCPFCQLQFETGQDYLNKNLEGEYNYPSVHISQLTAYAMGMDMKMIGMQYQMIAKDFQFKATEIEKQ